MQVEKTVEDFIDKLDKAYNTNTSFLLPEVRLKVQQIISEVKQQASIENTEKLINLGVVSEDYARHFRENLPKGITLKN